VSVPVVCVVVLFGVVFVALIVQFVEHIKVVDKWIEVVDESCMRVLCVLVGVVVCVEDVGEIFEVVDFCVEALNVYVEALDLSVEVDHVQVLVVDENVGEIDVQYKALCRLVVLEGEFLSIHQM